VYTRERDGKEKERKKERREARSGYDRRSEK